MASLNKVFLVGNLGQDIELKYTQAGKAFSHFSVACNEKRSDGNGGYRDFTEWVNIAAWGGVAENCAQYLTKGSQVMIEGKLTTSKYNKNGVTFYATKVLAHHVLFLSKKRNDFNWESGQEF